MRIKGILGLAEVKTGLETPREQKLEQSSELVPLACSCI